MNLKKNVLLPVLFILISFQNAYGNGFEVLTTTFNFYGHILGENQLKHRYQRFYSDLDKDIKEIIETYAEENSDNQLPDLLINLENTFPSLCNESSFKFFPPDNGFLRFFTWWTRNALIGECNQTTKKWISKIRTSLKITSLN